MTIAENLEQKTKTINSRGEHKKDNGGDLDREIERMHDAITERIQNRTPPCPIDGQKSSYVRMLGWRGDALYKCPNGHEFAMRGNLAKIIKD